MRNNKRQIILSDSTYIGGEYEEATVSPIPLEEIPGGSIFGVQTEYAASEEDSNQQHPYCSTGSGDIRSKYS
ncbi:hypothetical protein D3C87_1900570 [compost metagenome]